MRMSKNYLAIAYLNPSCHFICNQISQHNTGTIKIMKSIHTYFQMMNHELIRSKELDLKSRWNKVVFKSWIKKYWVQNEIQSQFSYFILHHYKNSRNKIINKWIIHQNYLNIRLKMTSVPFNKLLKEYHQSRNKRTKKKTFL